MGNTKGANILNIINDMGEISYEINYCADNMATSVKVIIYLFGILFFVGLAGFSIFLINLRLKKNDQNRFPADEEISSSSSESNDNITTNSNQQVTSPYISAAGDSLQVENLNGSHVKKIYPSCSIRPTILPLLSRARVWANTSLNTILLLFLRSLRIPN